MLSSPSSINTSPFSIYGEINSALNSKFVDLDSMQLLLQMSANVSSAKDQFLRQYLYNLQSKTNDQDASISSQSSQEDQQWLEAIEAKVALHLKEYEFTLNRLSELIYLSPRQLRRRLLRLTKMTFSQYLKTARLEKAYFLLQTGKVKSIKALANKVGMRDVKYFSKQFRVHFGESPSSYLN